jgi:hypothetical protein
MFFRIKAFVLLALENKWNTLGWAVDVVNYVVPTAFAFAFFNAGIFTNPIQPFIVLLFVAFSVANGYVLVNRQ